MPRIDGVNDALGGSYFRNKATIVDRLAAIYKAQSVTKPAAYVHHAMSVTKPRMRFSRVGRPSCFSLFRDHRSLSFPPVQQESSLLRFFVYDSRDR